MSKTIYAGIDAGSRAIKVVLIKKDNFQILASGVVDQGVEQESLALNLFNKVLSENNFSRNDIGKIIATGYGRNIIGFADETITEITCHAKGVHYLLPKTRTIIDIGGQDSKLIKLNEKGSVQDFVMNDRCAAGTGRFLEIIAERLKVDINEIGRLAKKSKNPKSISSMCVVFAETEIVGLLASGAPLEDIISGVLKSIAARVISMGGRLINPPIVFTGGVAMLPGMKEYIEAALKHDVIIPESPQMTGALGAAIFALLKERNADLH